MPLTNLISSNPTISIISISFLVTLAMTLFTKYFTDQNRMKELKKIQKACQIKLKDNKGNPEEQKKIQKEIMACSMELMKHSFKPMIFTFIPLIAIFWWVRGIFLETAIASTWLWWYIGAAIGSSIILRKVLDVA
jgi:uncharacterized membrane protein (DUF106 family)|tara:strand:+ start:14224 stop:14628 length:405 start_codon:yes stop_codon:yes gene_type:complete